MAWSPDGEQILYTCGLAVCVVEVDGTPVGRSPINRMDQTTRPVAAWSPDGARIAIAGTRVLRKDIVLYTMAPDGTDLRILVRRDAEAGLQALGARGPAGPVDVAGCAAGAAVPAVAADPGLVRDCETLLAIRMCWRAARSWTGAPTVPSPSGKAWSWAVCRRACPV